MNKSDCKCNRYPFKPTDPCYNVCTGNILSYVEPDILASIFAIPGNIAEKIRTLNLDVNFKAETKTLEDYKSVLDPAEFSQLNNIFSNLNSEALAWLNTNMGIETEVQEPVYS
ncbi:hypothetical protein ACPPVU_16230 [Mucilaginibacter sp. McL0603]|uniref:hypothetical protein n=1 Tax=Mucilaginibacter sp. McL0603 TaxID=3415670 RepID=UPI003CF37121